MPDLEQLQQEYEEARDAFRDNRDDEDAKARYEETKSAFVLARSAQRLEEEADPNHSRGQSLAVVDADDIPDDARELTDGEDE